MATPNMLRSILLMAAALPVAAPAQQLSIYLSASFNEQTGSVYAYAYTSVDYTTAYYYYTCTQIHALAEDGADGSYDVYYSSVDCTTPVSEVSWSFSVPTDTVYMYFQAFHDEYLTYLTYQFDPYCYSNCYDPWDAYGMSLLGSGSYSSPQSWYLAGPPGFSWHDVHLGQVSHREEGTFCFWPNYENTTFVAPENDPDYYGAEFTMQLDPKNGLAYYFARQITETFSNLSDTCHYSGSPYAKPSIGSFTPATWTVHSGTGLTWGSDFLGWNKPEVHHYQGRLSSGGSCVMFTDQQTVKMDGCKANSPFKSYETHTNTFRIWQYDLEVTRDGATGSGN